MNNYDIPQSVIDAIRKEYLVRPALLQKALRILSENRVRPSSSSQNWIVKSNTKERTEYTITPNADKCGCDTHPNVLCSHRLAVLIRLEMFKQTKQAALESGEPRKDVISLREQEVKKNKTKLVEWREEGLDDQETPYVDDDYELSYGQALAMGMFE